MYDLIIVGGGPAGMTAAIYAARKNMNFLFIAKDIGGELMKTTYIENYTGFKNISGEDLTKTFEDHMRQFNFKIIEDKVLSIVKNEDGLAKTFTVTTSENSFETKTILLNTGALPKSLSVPGEKEFANKGVSWCATCDGPLFAEKHVAVIGAGNTGLTTVLQMLDIADKVYLINKNSTIKADSILVEKAKLNPKLEIINDAMTESINGDVFVNSISIRLKDGSLKTIPVEGVFINIGYLPNTRCLNGLVNLTPFGDIIVDEKNMTSVAGIFAAGDVTNAPYKQIIIAAGAGANAVMAIYDYLAKFDN